MLYNFKDFHLSELFVATQDNFGNGGNEKKNRLSVFLCSICLKSGLLHFSASAYHSPANICLIHEVCICLHQSQMFSFPVLVTLGLYLDLLLPVSINSEHNHLPAANGNGSPRNIASNKNQSQRK